MLVSQGVSEAYESQKPHFDNPRMEFPGDAVPQLMVTEDLFRMFPEFTEPEGIKYLLQLDRIGIIELRPLNRYRLKLAKTFRWRPHGPVMQFFRAEVVPDYFRGGFDGEGEQLMLVHGEINTRLAQVFNERLARIASDFAQQHLADANPPCASSPATSCSSRH